VASVLDPVLGSVLGQLDNLTEVTGMGTVVIEQPTSCTSCPPPGTTPPSTPAPAGAACIIGTWTSTEVIVVGASVGGAGAIWTFRTDHIFTLDYGDGVHQGGSVFHGHAKFDYTTTANNRGSGTVTLVPISGDVSFTTPQGKTYSPGPGPTVTYDWTCSASKATFRYGSGADATEFIVAR
jgi:hypothetical protein